MYIAFKRQNTKDSLAHWGLCWSCSALLTTMSADNIFLKLTKRQCASVFLCWESWRVGNASLPTPCTRNSRWVALKTDSCNENWSSRHIFRGKSKNWCWTFESHTILELSDIETHPNNSALSLFSHLQKTSLASIALSEWQNDLTRCRSVPNHCFWLLDSHGEGHT